MLDGTRRGSLSAAELFAAPLRRDAASAYRWADIGEALGQADDRARAEYCFLRAARLAPSSPQILLDAGDFYFNLHEYPTALPYFGAILSLFDAYDSQVFNYYGRMGVDVSRILESGIPGKRAAQSYFRSLLAAHDLRRLDAVWTWMAERSLLDSRVAGEYTQVLLGEDLTEKAAKTWAVFSTDCDPGYLKTTQVYNGGFECAPAGSPFEWKISEADGAQAAIDTSERHEGNASLRIRFDGEHNVDYHHVTQAVFVAPGEYVLEAWIRSAKITTDEGVGFRIIDPKAPAELDIRTDTVKGTTGWTKLNSTFTTGPKTTLLQLQITRRASLRFDSLIRGTVWIDSVVVRRAKPKGHTIESVRY